MPSMATSTTSTTATNLYAIVMAGGAGTRFWPLSRSDTPKQLLALAGDSREPLLAATVRRLAPLVPAARIYVATGERLAEATARALPGVPRAQILAEPVPRNTAPCVGWAVMTILRRDPDAVIAVLPSDHFIASEPGFLRAMERAVEVAADDSLVTIGIVPTRPETGYGYIEVADRLAPSARGLPEAYRVARFVEKPDRARAESFVAGKRHLWNAGMFFFRGRAMTRAIEAHMPELWRGLEEIEVAAHRGEETEALSRVFPRLPSVSIDNGVMEKAERIAVVPGDFGWNDVGSWESAWELAPKDAEENALPEGAVKVDARGNYVCDRTSGTSRRVYALVGVSNLVLVETDDAVLLIPRERAQEVRAVVEALKARGDKGRL
jgi:mannose-1-phosphate guanylyltransferase